MIVQNTPEWEEIRRNHIGASDAPVIMGVSPWKTCYELWEEKLGMRKSRYTNAAMLRGQALEMQALQAYNQHVGKELSPEVVFHPEKKWMMASLDGFSKDHSVVEIKCPGKDDHLLAKNGVVPEKYFPQLQHQLAVVGASLLHYFSYVSDDDFHLVEIDRNEDYIAKLYKKEGEFWEKVLKFEPPPLDKEDFVHRNDAEWSEAVSAWLNVQKQLESFKQMEKTMKERLISLARGKNTDGGGIRLQKIIRKGSVNYRDIPEIKEIDVEKYRKDPIETWRIQTKKTL